ncbi:MAG: hypothetical protein FJ405_02510 [Verrucomicrobia bacterium]|nr:hypothetical protein [Verrucomicrobiota bacterium]
MALDSISPLSAQAEVMCILPLNGDVYVGGGFNFAGGNPVSGLALWNGGQWSDVGGSGLKPNDAVEFMVQVGSSIYISGGFSRIAGKPVRNFARWDGTEWIPMLTEGRGVGVRMIAANDTEIALSVPSFTDFGFGQHKGLALYHVPPRLHVEEQGEFLRVSWPGPAWRYWLEQSATCEPGSWSLSAKPQDGPDKTRFVDLPKDGSARFFRLRRIPVLKRE